MSRSRGKGPACLAALVATLLIAACAEEDGGPQFATDPRPARTLPQSAATPSPALLPTAASAATPTALVATPTSFTDLLAVRGAAAVVQVVSGGDVWAVSGDGKATRAFTAADGSTILAMDPSPDGRQIAILLDIESARPTRSEIVIADAAGSVVERAAIPTGFAATPVAGGGRIQPSIDWSPQGDRVLAQLETGEIVDITVGSGKPPSPLDFAGTAGRVSDPAWSPTGETIAFVSESDDQGTRSLQARDGRTGETRGIVTPPSGRLVVDFSWLPDGVSLLFTEGGGPGGAVTGIDLWRVDASGENRALVASAGTVAPVARIADLSPSPDGRSVAYTVLVPSSGGPAVDSVWVRSLESGIGFRITLPSILSVERIWWTDEGLVISVITAPTAVGRPATRALLRAGRDGVIDVLWAAPAIPATPAGATPQRTAASP